LYLTPQNLAEFPKSKRLVNLKFIGEFFKTQSIALNLTLDVLHFGGF